MFRPLWTILVKRENIQLYPSNHLIWTYFKDQERMEVMLPASSDFLNKRDGYQEFFICQTLDGMKFVMDKKDVQVV